MKTPHVPDDDDVLLDAILTDESWLALNDTLRHGTLASLRRRKWRRRVQRCAVGGSILALMLGASFWRSQPRSPENFEEKLASAPASRVLVRDFKGGELVALFPKGSCLMAEVDGRPTFVVLDEKLAAQGFRAQ